ncbi:MAG: enoyl-CoA hydratase/isomerase family protein [Variibacter sp.]|nr:enoyl-CoA hydratase/isomerase family protein [Variibacter sp.]
MNDAAVAASTDKVLSQRQGPVGTITFNNPARHNAMSQEMWAATADILERYAADPEVRVVVMTGAGGKAFVSGADISKFESERATQEAINRYNATSERLHDVIHHFPKPLIAKIKGYCIGGGLGLAVSCDLRFCTENSRFGVPAAKLGLGYAYGGTKRLVDTVGIAFAKEIFFTAKQFTAREAYEMGLVNRVVPEAELDALVADYAETIGNNAPLTVRTAKFTIAQTVEHDPDLKRCAEMVKECFASNDYIEGRRAFMEKRKAQFTGT